MAKVARRVGGVTIHTGDCRAVLKTLPDASVHCVVTSPPYWRLRDYGCDGQIGLEATPEAFLAEMVAVFREVRRVLRDDGVCWVNMGDGYNANGRIGHGARIGHKQGTNRASSNGCDDARATDRSLKPKDLIGMPWRLAFALQADGWWLRSDVIWCLSGGTWLYVRSQKGDMPMMVRDMARLNPTTVQLWNGEKWTQLIGMNKNARAGNELEIVLRSGERISCTPTHRFPTTSGLVNASELTVGDILTSCTLPEPETPKDCAIDGDAAWFAGLYIAEGSRSGGTIQISGHVKESDRWERVWRIAKKFGGSATKTVDGNNQSIRVYGKVLHAIIDELVSGVTAIDKGFASVVWRYSNKFIAEMVDGYLSGDGHADGNRWRLGFCRNYNLERDLRTACARLGYTLTLNASNVEYNGRQIPTFRGELRKKRSGHHNELDRNTIVNIRKARCREIYDLGVADDPHLFALASGVLTHNSKPNPMPESVTDRPTKAHEYVFLLTKRERYFYDAEAVKEDSTDPEGSAERYKSVFGGVKAEHLLKTNQVHTRPIGMREFSGKRNLRTVWTIPTHGFAEAHFATFPTALAERCIKAGTSGKGCCPACGAPWERVVDRQFKPQSDVSPQNGVRAAKNQKPMDDSNGWAGFPRGSTTALTTGFRPTCACPPASPVPCTVLDPFGGAGTVGLVAERLQRRAVLIELNPAYAEMAERRLRDDAPLICAAAEAAPGAA